MKNLLVEFAAWLTTRPEPVTLGAEYESSVAADLVEEFMSIRGLPMAREYMALRFEKDPDLKRAYVDNVAVLIMDDGAKPYASKERRDQLAERIIDRIFMTEVD